MNKRLAARFLGSLLMAALLSAVQGFALAKATDYAMHLDKAASSLLLDIAVAGERLVAVGERGHILYSEDGGEELNAILGSDIAIGKVEAGRPDAMPPAPMVARTRAFNDVLIRYMQATDLHIPRDRCRHRRECPSCEYLSRVIRRLQPLCFQTACAGLPYVNEG